MSHQSRVRTFPDSGVLIAAWGTRPELKERALAVLEDPARLLLSSPFVRHEVCPKAIVNRRQLEFRFYRAYFQNVEMFNDVRLILERAGRESAQSGASAMDSLHLAAAHFLKADVLITTGKPTRSPTRTLPTFQ